MSSTIQNMYKSNYEALQVLPLVQKLKQENRALKMENKKLLGALMNLLALVEPDKKKPASQSASQCASRSTSQSTSRSKPLRKQPVVDIKIEPTNVVKKNKPNLTIDTEDECVIIYPTKNSTPNIVYEIEEADIEAAAQKEEEEEEAASQEEEEEEEEAAAEEEEEEEAEEADDACEEEKEAAAQEEEEDEEDAATEAEEDEEAAAEEEEEEEEAADACEEEEEEAADACEEEEEEEEAADACEEEEEEVKEVIINKKTYYTDDEKNGTIYDVDENGDVSLEVGKFVKGVAKFY